MAKFIQVQIYRMDWWFHIKNQGYVYVKGECTDTSQKYSTIWDVKIKQMNEMYWYITRC